MSQALTMQTKPGEQGAGEPGLGVKRSRGVLGLQAGRCDMSTIVARRLQLFNGGLFYMPCSDAGNDGLHGVSNLWERPVSHVQAIRCLTNDVWLVVSVKLTTDRRRSLLDSCFATGRNNNSLTSASRVRLDYSASLHFETARSSL